MIYLPTGGNGAGKTLFTLHDVRKQQLAENRPVYYHGFAAGEQLRDWGWQTFDPKKWQDLPDGSICIFDECQNEFPAKIQGELPDYINAVAQHRRRRGFDFWMITPHPSLIHVNIRRLIESPSWHRHLKRTFGADMVSEIKFSYAETACEKPGAGDKGQVTMRAFPKEAYSWYQSASLHTSKRRIPKQVWLLGGALVATLVLGFFGYKSFMSGLGTNPDDNSFLAVATANSIRQTEPPEATRRPLNLFEYLTQAMPRISGMAHTAPRYDSLTVPITPPRPTSCLKFGSNPCVCKTQQGTLIDMSEASCIKTIESGGIFVDWDVNTRFDKETDYQYSDYYQTDSIGGIFNSRNYNEAISQRKNTTKEQPLIPAGLVNYDGNRPMPVYPRSATRNGREGRVIVRVLISELGDVSSASVLKTSGYADLDKSALDAAKRASFKPYRVNGIAKSALTDIPFDFTLKK